MTPSQRRRIASLERAVQLQQDRLSRAKGRSLKIRLQVRHAQAVLDAALADIEIENAQKETSESLGEGA